MTILPFFVQPGASKTEVVGWHGDAIKVRVKAPPADGAANRELIRFLAKTLKTPKDSIKIARGQTSRRKHVAFEEMSGNTVIGRLLGSS